MNLLDAAAEWLNEQLASFIDTCGIESVFIDGKQNKLVMVE